MLQNVDENGDYIKYFIFSDEAAYHTVVGTCSDTIAVCGVLKIPTLMEFQRASAKVDVWSAIAHDKVIRPIFVDDTISSYLLPHSAAGVCSPAD
jgi:hypothetical protein